MNLNQHVNPTGFKVQWIFWTDRLFLTWEAGEPPSYIIIKSRYPDIHDATQRIHTNCSRASQYTMLHTDLYVRIPF